MGNARRRNRLKRLSVGACDVRSAAGGGILKTCNSYNMKLHCVLKYTGEKMYKSLTLVESQPDTQSVKKSTLLDASFLFRLWKSLYLSLIIVKR